MARELIFHPAIADDVALALAYYDEISRTLGNRFRDNVKDPLSNISESLRGPPEVPSPNSLWHRPARRSGIPSLQSS